MISSSSSRQFSKLDNYISFVRACISQFGTDSLPDRWEDITKAIGIEYDFFDKNNVISINDVYAIDTIVHVVYLRKDMAEVDIALGEIRSLEILSSYIDLW